MVDWDVTNSGKRMLCIQTFKTNAYLFKQNESKIRALSNVFFHANNTFFNNFISYLKSIIITKIFSLSGLI